MNETLLHANKECNVYWITPNFRRYNIIYRKGYSTLLEKCYFVEWATLFFVVNHDWQTWPDI
jgi:hypothetical protein